MMASSKKPLLALLETVSQVKRQKAEPDDHTHTLFLQLKDFYDPKGKLSLPEALGDKNLIRRLRDLFVFFYGRKHLSLEETKGWLKTLEMD